MTLAVVTDSAACLPAEAVRTHGITVVPLHRSGGEEGAETTSRPSVEELARAYEEAAGRASEVLAVHVSGALSGTVDNARLAAARLNGARPGTVSVLDSGTCAGALALAVLTACQAEGAHRGAALVRESVARSLQLFVVDDLRHLARSGRIDRTTARLGEVLSVRPVLAVLPEGIGVVETVRGRSRARRHLVDHVVRAAGGTELEGPRPPAEPALLAVQAQDPEAAEDLRTRLDEAMTRSGARVSQVLTLPVDDALAVHLGPGALGAAVAPVLPVTPSFLEAPGRP